MDIDNSVAFPLLIIGWGEIEATVKTGYDQNQASGAHPRNNQPREMVKTGRRTESVKADKPSRSSGGVHFNKASRISCRLSRFFVNVVSKH